MDIEENEQGNIQEEPEKKNICQESPGRTSSWPPPDNKGHQNFDKLF